MKIAKIINIMKFITSSPLPVGTGDNPSLRVIIPTVWGASPHVLGKRVGRRGLGQQESAAPSGTPKPGRSRAPTASHIKVAVKGWHRLSSLCRRSLKPAATENSLLSATQYQMNYTRSVRKNREKSGPAESCRGCLTDCSQRFS
jgi:hypothetical protein